MHVFSCWKWNIFSLSLISSSVAGLFPVIRKFFVNVHLFLANKCRPNPCQNAARCLIDMKRMDGYRCQCTSDFTGHHCQGRQIILFILKYESWSSHLVLSLCRSGLVFTNFFIEIASTIFHIHHIFTSNYGFTKRFYSFMSFQFQNQKLSHLLSKRPQYPVQKRKLNPRKKLPQRNPCMVCKKYA